MEVDVTKNVQVEQDEFSPEPSIEEMIESSPLLEGEEEEQAKETPAAENEAEGKVEDKTESEPKEEKAKEEEAEKKPEEQGLTEEQFEELAGKHPVLKEYKKFFDNYHTWEDNLTKRGQAISFLTKLAKEDPERYEILQNKLMPYVYGKEEVPKTPAELVEEVMQTLPKEGIKFVDEDELEVEVPYEQLSERDKRLTEAVLTKAVPEMAQMRQKLETYMKENEELKANLQTSTRRQGELEMESLAKKHPLLDFKRKDGESIIDAVTRIAKAGEEHPEFSVLAKWKAVGKLADENGWKLEKAYEMLYGAEERQIVETKSAKEIALKNQQGATQESPNGDQPKTVEDWEEAMEGIGDRHSVISDMFN